LETNENIQQKINKKVSTDEVREAQRVSTGFDEQSGSNPGKNYTLSKILPYIFSLLF